MSEKGEVRYFESAGAFRAWLAAHHDSVGELWVGLWKKATGRPSMTWPESVEEALCFGWIDGLRRSVDEESYAIRFTPRRPGSVWSAKNLKTYRALEEAGRLREPGRAAFERRDPEKTDRYSFEGERAELSEAFRERLESNAAARAFFEAQPPSYRKTVTWWVMSAKRAETRERRLATLIEDSAAGLRVKPLRR